MEPKAILPLFVPLSIINLLVAKSNVPAFMSNPPPSNFKYSDLERIFLSLSIFEFKKRGRVEMAIASKIF